MIIKGLDHIKAWQDAEHQRNINQWYRSRGDYNNASWLEEYDDEICAGRGISRMHFDVPN